MTVHQILHYPDKRLRIPGKPIEVFDEALSQLIEDMAETMYFGSGVGLAAPQIGVSKRLFIIDIANGDDDAPSDLRVFANPVILDRQGRITWNEGCLSFPNIREDIERAEKVVVKAQDGKGKSFELKAEGLLSVAIQHENDHLDGKLIVDHISLLRRRLVNRAMNKLAQQSDK